MTETNNKECHDCRHFRPAACRVRLKLGIDAWVNTCVNKESPLFGKQVYTFTYCDKHETYEQFYAQNNQNHG